MRLEHCCPTDKASWTKLCTEGTVRAGEVRGEGWPGAVWAGGGPWRLQTVRAATLLPALGAAETPFQALELRSLAAVLQRLVEE